MEIAFDTKPDKLLSKIRNDIEKFFAESKGQKVLLLVAGGSVIEIFQELQIDSLDQNVTITMLDERFSANTSASNFNKLKNTKFFKDCINSGVKFIDTIVSEYDDLKNFTKFWEQQLQQWHISNPFGKIAVVCGVGEDGHIAGMLPMHNDNKKFKSLFVETHRWAVGYTYDGDTNYNQRVTTTINFLLNKVDITFAWCIDDFVLKEIVGGNTSYYLKPAKVLFDMKNVKLYTNVELELPSNEEAEKIENGFNLNKSRKITL